MKPKLFFAFLLIAPVLCAAGCGQDSGGAIRPLPKAAGAAGPHRHGGAAPSTDSTPKAGTSA